MPRQPKPFFRKQTQSWYCSISGKQISLGTEREAAFDKFHRLMGDKSSVKAELTTLYELSQVYLDWCKDNRSPATYDKHLRYLKSFIDSVGKRLRPSKLKTHQVAKWHEGLKISSTSQSDAVGALQRMLNWAVENDYLDRNPITNMKKPRRKRRDIFYTADQWATIKSHATGPLIPFLDFLYCTGCRPFEARTMEARHIHGDLVIFSADESKGETDPRVIYLAPLAKQIIEQQVKQNPTGPLFRNSQGKPWKKNAIKCRLRRISEKCGFRVIAYGARHSFATNALIEGGVDPVSLAHLMVHKDVAMISRVYSHVAKNPDFLRKQAAKAVGKTKHS